MAVPRLCSIEDCDNRAYARTWCLKHYTRWQRHGSPHERTRAANGEVLDYVKSLIRTPASADCIEWPYYRLKNGYAAINRNRKPTVASRLICELVHGKPANRYMQAAHSCGKGNSGCVNPHHISWKTRAENASDKVKHGTLPIGERHKSSKLTADEVLAIRRIGSDMPQRTIAVMFNVSQGLVGHILSRRVWRHI